MAELQCLCSKRNDKIWSRVKEFEVNTIKLQHMQYPPCCINVIYEANKTKLMADYFLIVCVYMNVSQFGTSYGNAFCE